MGIVFYPTFFSIAFIFEKAPREFEMFFFIFQISKCIYIYMLKIINLCLSVYLDIQSQLRNYLTDLSQIQVLELGKTSGMFYALINNSHKTELIFIGNKSGKAKSLNVCSFKPERFLVRILNIVFIFVQVKCQRKNIAAQLLLRKSFYMKKWSQIIAESLNSKTN